MAKILHLQQIIDESGAKHLIGLLQDAYEKDVDLGPRGPHMMSIVQTLDDMATKLRQAHSELLILPRPHPAYTSHILSLSEELIALLDTLLKITRGAFSSPISIRPHS